MRQTLITRILIVDADELSLALIRASLETQDYLALSAFDCGKALDYAASESLDLVICDCDMLTDTGVHVQALIHSIPRNADVPFLFTSSSQKPDVISRRRDDRNVFFIRKPFEHEAFLELVEYAMWMPNLIRSHIEKMHLQQGLKRPHVAALAEKSVSGGGVPFPSVSVPMPGLLPNSFQ
ncbi:response regulator [Mariniblastus fucicola]|uniref:Response regulator of RpoS n=1 Tax=Mariniblastus fucicola TaxID=980251 RepID=A0A5B9PBQ7_9BACT|nr:response regulator [Mariniblastus fucicola]QEG21926.1 response regulator of RpoS [Mariniblastus fucicola]